jgi:hypothetical protein
MDYTLVRVRRGIFVEAALEQSLPSRVESLPPMIPLCCCPKSEENPKVGASGWMKQSDSAGHCATSRLTGLSLVRSMLLICVL